MPSSSPKKSPHKNMGHPLPSLNPLNAPQADSKNVKSLAQRMYIPVKDPLDHTAPAILHVQKTMSHSDEAVILISGAGGGVSGPAGIYVALADKLAKKAHVPTMRLDYREPAANEYCTPDVIATMDYLKDKFDCKRFVIVGWSFGGAPAFTAAAQDDRIVGVATIASQTAETNGVSKLSPRPLLVLHGTGDKVLAPRCSENIYQAYGAKGERTLKLFDGDDHGLTEHALEAEELIFNFAAKALGKVVPGANEDKENPAKTELIGGKSERIEVMKQGHDLEGERL